MKEKIIAFGTTQNVTVDKTDKAFIIVIADEIKEAFILVGHGLKILPTKGDKGTIVFERGGIKGGFWQYYPNQSESK